MLMLQYCALCRNNVDPFDEPECEARDIFVNELLCIGTGTCSSIASVVKDEGFVNRPCC
jgi:heterodisulfide reductase subunit A-like polyferredoxin